MSDLPEPDWRDPWPVRGVGRGEPMPSVGADALRADGYRYVADVEAIEGDHDAWQRHLNNTAPTRMFNELRVAYVAANLAPDWPRHVRRGGLAVVVRELHVLYETEATVDEGFVGGTRVVRRQGKAGFMEQRLVEATAARPVARAWLVQLVVRDGAAAEWPPWYWEMVGRVEGHVISELAPAPRAAWGPPGSTGG